MIYTYEKDITDRTIKCFHARSRFNGAEGINYLYSIKRDRKIYEVIKYRNGAI